MRKKNKHKLVVDKEIKEFLNKWLPNSYYIDLEDKLKVSRFRIMRVKMGEIEDTEIAKILVQMAIENKKIVEDRNEQFNDSLKKQILHS